MKTAQLSSMKRGWFIGDFSPSLCRTTDFEAAVKYYSEGDYEEKHYHSVATEYTIIISGRVQMNDRIFSEGDIVILDPGEASDFRCLEKTVTVVIKMPSAKDDKYLVRE